MFKERITNFSPGPAALPLPVLEEAREEFLNFAGMGASVVEISHRTPEFIAVIEETEELYRELAGLSDNWRILFVHGGARMQFAAVPMNLFGPAPDKKALYIDTGLFSALAAKEAARYGAVTTLASGKDSGYSTIPAVDPGQIGPDAAWVHLTSNNTVYGTHWAEFPDTGQVPLVVDATSDVLSRQMDYERIDLLYAGLQKCLGPSGLAVVVIRKELIGEALPPTPGILRYSVLDETRSLANTTNTFGIYMMRLVLRWLRDQGGVAAMEKINQEKAGLIYDKVDGSEFWTPCATLDSRSIMNITFGIAGDEDERLQGLFVDEALQEGLYGLRGHKARGGLRASLYNAMPLAGARKLAEFMADFEKRYG